MTEVAFLEPARAERNLARIHGLVPDRVFKLLPTLLNDSPDPDSALNLLERLATETTPEVMQLLQENPPLVHYVLCVFGYSHYLGETLLRNQDLLPELISQKSLDQSLGCDDYRQRLRHFLSESKEADVAALLARFKKREYVRIMLRDVLNIAPLAAVTAEISALADVLIEHALESCAVSMEARYGRQKEGKPGVSGFSVISLGKLGGNELNYNSDVDLLYLFQDGDEVPGTTVPRGEYSIRLAQQITDLLARVTSEGQVFRIDLRLRPQGNDGEPALPLSRALHYYASSAQDWELQALIKARCSAGDGALVRKFIRGVDPRVYRAGLNLSAIETALHSAERIRLRRNRRIRPSGIDVKLDRGGIRDIEFLVQCLQRVHGGDESWLRSGGTLYALQRLSDKRHISGKDFHDLTQAYEFLRRLEHRLQLREGQQTHRLSASTSGMAILARSMGRSSDGVSASSPDTLLSAVHRHMERVTEIYERVMHTQQSLGERSRSEKEFALLPAVSVEEARDGSYEQLLARLSEDSQALYQIASRRNLSGRCRRLLHRFLSSALTSPQRYAAVLHSAGALEQALTVFEGSDFLSDVLIRYPDEISTIEQAARQPRPDGSLQLGLEADPALDEDPIFAFASSPELPYAEKMVLLRRHFRHRVFAIGVQDLFSHSPVFESLDQTTIVADGAIRAAFNIAQEQLRPQEREIGSNFAVLALGRLGAREFDLGSDADLLFVREEGSSAAAARHLAEYIVEALAAYTQEGTVFAVDTRLRPLGAEGELVTTPSALRNYFDLSGEAQAWEALSFMKLRPLAGSVPLARRATVAVRAPTERFAASAGFASKVLAMRDRVAQSEPGGASNFKIAAGGFYDIDFITAYLLIRHRLPFEAGNTRKRLHALAANGLLSDADCATLDYGVELLRAAEHAIRLFSGRARAVLPQAEHARQTIQHLTSRMLDEQEISDLQSELRRVQESVRAVFNRVIV